MFATLDKLKEALKDATFLLQLSPEIRQMAEKNFSCGCGAGVWGPMITKMLIEYPNVVRAWVEKHP